MKNNGLALVVGEFNDDTSVYTYASSFARVLAAQGYDVSTFNFQRSWIFGFRSQLAFALPRPLAVVNAWLMNRALLAIVRKQQPELIFFLKAHTVTPRTLRVLKRGLQIRLINFYPDSPFLFDNGNSHPRVLKAARLYDSFLVWSRPLVSKLHRFGCLSARYMPLAFEAARFPELQGSASGKTYDVVFVGTWDYDREYMLSYLVSRMPKLRFGLWGNMWDERLTSRSPLRAYLQGAAIYNEHMVNVFRLSKIVLNFLREQNIGAHNMRTFEVPAAGAFLLTQYSSEQMHELFVQGESIDGFRSKIELVKKVRFYLNNDDIRECVARNGTEQVKRFSIDVTLKGVLNS